MDLASDNGVKFTGSYDGNILVNNLNDSENAPKIKGNVPEDMTLDFVPTTLAMSYAMGDYIKEGVNQFTVWIIDEQQNAGDYVQLELSSDQEVIADGTYTINNKIEPLNCLKGFMDFGGIPLSSWFINLDDQDAPHYGMRTPVMGSTVTITTTGETTKKNNP